MDAKAQVEAAVAAHRSWYVRVRIAIENAIESEARFEPSLAATDTSCEFGRWLYQDFPVLLRDSPIYQEIKQLHAEFHEHAGRILAVALRGEREAALDAMKSGSEFNMLSLKLVGRMQQLKEELELWAASSRR